MHGDDGAVFEAVDFVRAPDGLWFDAVTGRSADSFPEGSSADPANPDHRVLYKEVTNADDVVVAEYKRQPCGADSSKSRELAADNAKRWARTFWPRSTPRAPIRPAMPPS